MKIPIARTSFTAEDLRAIQEPLETGWVVQGPFVKRFEEAWSAFTGAPCSVAVTSCTTALHLSLAALGIGPGDDVVVPAFTWIATANVVEQLGARPVFCDIDLTTFNLDPMRLESVLTPAVRAVIPVHLFGRAAEMDPILAIAGRRALHVVEDAACGFASKYRGRHVGCFGAAGCFSFHPRKAITTGEGGMITTADAALAIRLRALRDHGATLSDHQRHLGARPYLLPDFPYAGYNYRMTDLQAALGCSQMDRAAEIQEKRLDWVRRYREELNGLPWLRLPAAAGGSEHGYQSFVCLFEPEAITPIKVEQQRCRRNGFMDYLEQQGISTRPGTHAVHMLQYYVAKYGLRPEDCPNAWAADACSIALPLFPSLTAAEFDHVVTRVRAYRPDDRANSRGEASPHR
jgi:dTDP-4-amino-4,6-dideoxygalactose transaminase